MDPPAPRPISRSTLFLGLIGTSVLVVGGALAGAVAPEASGRFWSVPTVPVRTRIDLVPALAMFYGGLILLVRAWLRLRRECLRRDASVAAVVLVAVVWSLPLLVGPPLGSRDVYAYAAQGRMAAEGLDVYEQGPSALGDDPVLDSVDLVGDEVIAHVKAHLAHYKAPRMLYRVDVVPRAPNGKADYETAKQLAGHTS